MIFSSCLLQTAAHRTPMINQSLCLHSETAARVSSAHPTVHVARTFSHMESKYKLSLLLFLPVVFTDSSTPDCSYACLQHLPSPPAAHMCKSASMCSIYPVHVRSVCIYSPGHVSKAHLSESACTYLFSLKKVQGGGGGVLKSVCAYSHTQE